jgi:NitT/TauT family transport system permease protein
MSNAHDTSPSLRNQSRAAAFPTSKTSHPARRATKPSWAQRLRAQLFTREGLLTLVGRIAVLLTVGVGWQLAATYQIVNPIFCGIPTRIIAEFINAITGPIFSTDAISTVSAAICGAAIASVLGISTAFLLAQSNILRRIFDPYFTLLNGLPRVALAPLFLMLFGIGFAGKLTLAASITYFVTFYNTMVGVDSVDRDHLVLAKALGASRLQLFVKFVVPSAIPSIFAGLQLGFVYGMLGTVASEMIAGQAGLGVVLTRQAALFQMNTYYATLLLLGIMTTTISSLLELIRVRLLRWQRAHMIKV